MVEGRGEEGVEFSRAWVWRGGLEKVLEEEAGRGMLVEGGWSGEDFF